MEIKVPYVDMTADFELLLLRIAFLPWATYSLYSTHWSKWCIWRNVCFIFVTAWWKRRVEPGVGEEDLLTQERPSANKNCWYGQELWPTPSRSLGRLMGSGKSHWRAEAEKSQMVNVGTKDILRRSSSPRSKHKTLWVIHRDTEANSWKKD